MEKAWTSIKNAYEIVLQSEGNDILRPVLLAADPSFVILTDEFKKVNNLIKIQKEVLDVIPAAKFASLSTEEKISVYQKKAVGAEPFAKTNIGVDTNMNIMD